MKPLSEKRGTEKLRILKDEFRERVREGWELRAKNCLTCETQGACCLDAHFVNVHLTRLEAVLINDRLSTLPEELRKRVASRTREAIERYSLSDEGDTFARTFACPLFEKGVGCLVQDVKPLPCIAHACYENREDLPPDEVLESAQEDVGRLNRQVYREPAKWRPLPIVLRF